MPRLALELWGGPECTVNRVGDQFGDQFERSGHTHRFDDLDLFVDLGITAIRYPVLWEKVSPERPDLCDWRLSDIRLPRLRALGVGVIAGLVHHGSGPAYTSLLDDHGFAAGLAAHARHVADRYPWIDRWTPVNEPLTTARFSALYGHWYPHQRDERSFWRALLNQIDGVRLSMAAIRKVIPHAQLIQTDDVGRTFSTADLRDQARFDNLRRWAGWDLLCGRVTEAHPLWQRIASFGLAGRLAAIAEAPCPPDIIGVNHYLTSDRSLDHRLDRYPEHLHGGNGRQRYVDIEAVRALETQPPGLEGALRETWERYRIPVAVTEVHNGCTREEQMRWMAEAWDTGERLTDEGVDIRAITIWSLLGSSGWNTLLTRPGVYEPGVFDVSSGKPRPTALAGLMRGLPHDAPRHPVTRDAGWWRRRSRLLHPAVDPAVAPLHNDPPKGSQLLIVGATGTLGQAFVRACTHRNLACVPVSREELELRDGDMIARVLDRYRPWAVVNAAGWVRVDDAEQQKQACHDVNCSGAVRLSAAADSCGIPTVNFSSDLVFDGRVTAPYVESDSPAPLSAYGRSKAHMEEGVLALRRQHLIIRTAAFFSPFDAYNFASIATAVLSRGDPFRAANDLMVSPTYVPHLVDTVLDLLIDGETGIWHLTNETTLSWSSFGMRIAEEVGLPGRLVQPVPARRLGLQAPRPAFAGLATARGAALPPLQIALADFAARSPQNLDDRRSAVA